MGKRRNPDSDGGAPSGTSKKSQDFNPFEVLGVSRGADNAAIRSAYRKLALQAHPDKGGSEEAFILIGRAFAILSDVAARADYEAKEEASKRKARRVELARSNKKAPPQTPLERALLKLDESLDGIDKPVRQGLLMSLPHHIKEALIQWKMRPDLPQAATTTTTTATTATATATTAPGTAKPAFGGGDVAHSRVIEEVVATPATALAAAAAAAATPAAIAPARTRLKKAAAAGEPTVFKEGIKQDTTNAKEQEGEEKKEEEQEHDEHEEEKHNNNNDDNEEAEHEEEEDEEEGSEEEEEDEGSEEEEIVLEADPEAPAEEKEPELQPELQVETTTGPHVGLQNPRPAGKVGRPPSLGARASKLAGVHRVGIRTSTYQASVCCKNLQIFSKPVSLEEALAFHTVLVLVCSGFHEFKGDLDFKSVNSCIDAACSVTGTAREHLGLTFRPVVSALAEVGKQISGARTTDLQHSLKQRSELLKARSNGWAALREVWIAVLSESRPVEEAEEIVDKTYRNHTPKRAAVEATKYRRLLRNDKRGLDYSRRRELREARRQSSALGAQVIAEQDFHRAVAAVETAMKNQKKTEEVARRAAAAEERKVLREEAKKREARRKWLSDKNRTAAELRAGPPAHLR